MGCLFVMLSAFFPRLAVFMIWLARPTYFSSAFGGSWFWPLLGTIFLPFTTLLYVLMWSPTGLTGWDWLWLILAFVLDVSYIAMNGWTGYRFRMPGGPNSSTHKASVS